jgi:hypothetical protein
MTVEQFNLEIPVFLGNPHPLDDSTVSNFLEETISLAQSYSRIQPISAVEGLRRIKAQERLETFSKYLKDALLIELPETDIEQLRR